MQTRFLNSMLWKWITSLIFLALGAAPAFAQGGSLATLNDSPLNSGAASSIAAKPTSGNTAAMVASPSVAASLSKGPDLHRFWDTENRALFATAAILSAADFAVTRSILQNGGKELNPVTRLFSGSTAGLAANFTGETAGIVGLSYFFHRTGHHKLERITPMLDIGSSSFAVIYDLNHR
jgi:hypothetical protein